MINFSKNSSCFLIILFFVFGILSVHSSFSTVCAAPSSSTSSTASSKAASNQSTTSSHSSLLPGTGKSQAEAASQNWSEIMSGINANADSDEFTFEKSSDSSFANMSSWMFIAGVSLIGLSVLGFFYVIYSQFFSRKSPRKMRMLAQERAETRMPPASSQNASYRAKRPVPRNTAAKRRSKVSSAQYDDGYGHIERKDKLSSTQKRSSATSRSAYPTKAPAPPARRTGPTKKEKDEFWDQFFNQ